MDDNPDGNPNGPPCYHVWHLAAGGNALFRWAQCYTKRTAALAAARRWRSHNDTGRGRRPAPVNPNPQLDVYRVLKCDGAGHCPCPCAIDAARRELDGGAIAAGEQAA